MRKIRLFVASICVAIASLAIMPVSAGAVTVDCPGSPTNDGWFDAHNPFNNRHGSVKCTIDGNHITLNMTANYNGTSYTALGAVDIWFPWYCTAPIFTNGAGNYVTFGIALQDYNSTYGCGLNDLIYNSGNTWYTPYTVLPIGNYFRQYRAGGTNNLWADSGAGSIVVDAGGWNNTLPFVQMSHSSDGNPHMGKMHAYLHFFPGA